MGMEYEDSDFDFGDGDDECPGQYVMGEPCVCGNFVLEYYGTMDIRTSDSSYGESQRLEKCRSCGKVRVEEPNVYYEYGVNWTEFDSPFAGMDI